MGRAQRELQGYAGLTNHATTKLEVFRKYFSSLLFAFVRFSHMPMQFCQTLSGPRCREARGAASTAAPQGRQYFSMNIFNDILNWYFKLNVILN